MKYYKNALYIAAKAAYKDEVIDTGMFSLTIGDDEEFATAQDWIDARVQEWLDDAALARTPPPPTGTR
jgi:hypothetical protein